MLLLSLLPTGPAAAAGTEVIPSLELRQEYTDNLLFSAAKPLGSFITRVTPAVTATGRSEILSGSLAAKLTGLHYSDNGKRDNLEQFYDAAAGGLLTPLLKLSGSATYRKESSPEREIETSGQALNVTSRRQLYGGSAEYRISELTAGSLGCGYDQVTYGTQIGYSNVTSYNATAGLTHDAERLLPLLKLRSSVRYSRSNYDTAQIDNYALIIGASRQLHELWSFSADGGARYTRSGFQVLTFDPATGFGVGHDQNDSIGWVLASSLDYQGEKFQGSLSYNRDLSTASGSFRSAVESDVVNFSLRRRLSYELSAALGGGYYRSIADNNQFGSQKVDDTSWRGSFSLRYTFNRKLSADVGYDWYHLDSKASGSATSRNKVFFQVTAQTTLFE